MPRLDGETATDQVSRHMVWPRQRIFWISTPEPGMGISGDAALTTRPALLLSRDHVGVSLCQQVREWHQQRA